MQPDYTITDAFREGFECGVVYILRYLKEDPDCVVNNLNLFDLACHLEVRKPWKTAEEWCDVVRNS